MVRLGAVTAPAHQVPIGYKEGNHMSRILTRIKISVALVTGLLLVTSGLSVAAYGSYSGNDYGYNNGGYGDTNGPSRASSYINRDTGAATENTDVNADSGCRNPDQYDNQKLSDPGTTNRNVHNDGCLYRSYGGYGGYGGSSYGGNDYFDGYVTFESSGVGVIAACPDPDGAGPKTATLSADKLRCTQSGYQMKGTAGDFEYHTRLNNTDAPGQQRVTMCYDPERNGCGDARVKSSITINWYR